MKRIIFLCLSILSCYLLMTPISSGKNDKLAVSPESKMTYGQDIYFDNADKGVVSVFYNNFSDKKLKLVVQLGSDKYIYNLFNNEVYINYPLQLGNGYYTVSIYENTTGSKYRKVLTKSSQVALKDSLSVYLQSILEIDWKYEDESIELVDKLVEKALNDKRAKMNIQPDKKIDFTQEEIIDALYSFVIKTIEYDYEKINNLDYSYLPDNDRTLELESGICYDYSSLLASMLRSQGIASKMAKGYANTSSVYHAWNEVYLEKQKRWVVVDTTYDAYMIQNGYKYSFEKTRSNYNKVKEF